MRGQEGIACQRSEIPFIGVSSDPLLGTPYQRFKTMLNWIKSAKHVTAKIKTWNADILFSTGGYSAAPVLMAAKKTRMPIIAHEQNVIPSRSTLFAAKLGATICTVFEKTKLSSKTIHTGMPLRKELVDAANKVVTTKQNDQFIAQENKKFVTLAFGGSQGSLALNEAFLTMIMRTVETNLSWILISGPSFFEKASLAAHRLCHGANLTVRPYMETEELINTYIDTDLAISRAGAGAVSELALFGIPSILIPYPHAYADHQSHNAAAIVETQGATLLPQSKLTPETLETAWQQWKNNTQKRNNAAEALSNWVIRDATEKVFNVIKQAEYDKSH